jgi:hypothetical protein
MAFESAAHHVAQHIAQIAPGLEYGKTVRVGAPNKPSTNQTLTGAIPEKCVFVLPTRGLTAEAWKGGGGIRKPSVQVWCRGVRNNFNDAYALAVAVWDALEQRPPAGYFEARALYSGPEYLQQDEMGCHEFVINVDLRMQV